MHVPIIVRIGRTTVITVALGMDVSGDTFTSEIRKGKSADSLLLATWTVSFSTDGTDGELVLTIDDSETNTIEHTNGFMDLKRVSGGEPLSVFSHPLPVVFEGVVTA